MKRILLPSMIVAMLIFCCGCEASENVSEITPVPTPEVISTPAPTPEPTLAATLTPELEEEYIATALFLKMNTWDSGNIIIHMVLDSPGYDYKSDSICNVLSDKYYVYSTATAGDFIELYDGEFTYQYDFASSTYFVVENNPERIPNYLNEKFASPELKDCFTSDGIEDIFGTEFYYEEYCIDDTYVRFYFDSENNIQYLKQPIGDVDTIWGYTVEFSEVPDESVFSITPEQQPSETATYVGKGAETLSTRPQSHDLVYSEGDFLKEALCQVSADKLFCGPEHYERGDYLYRCGVEGTFEWFWNYQAATYHGTVHGATGTYDL